MKFQPIELDFSSTARRVPALGNVLLSLGLLALALGTFAWGSAWSTRVVEADALSRIESREAAAKASALRAKQPQPAEQARDHATLRVVNALQAPWSDLLSALESAPRGNVALLAIEPSVAKRQIRLTAEARNIESMIEYLAALQRDERLSQVSLASHQVQAQAPGHPVRFTLQAAWSQTP